LYKSGIVSAYISSKLNLSGAEKMFKKGLPKSFGRLRVLRLEVYRSFPKYNIVLIGIKSGMEREFIRYLLTTHGIIAQRVEKPRYHVLVHGKHLHRHPLNRRTAH